METKSQDFITHFSRLSNASALFALVVVMMNIASLFISLLFLLNLVKTEDIATTLYPYIYSNLNNWPCVRLLNATDAIGCHSLEKKAGILYELETQQDVSQFIQSSRSGDYAIVLPYQLLNKANLQALGSTNRIAGLIVIVGNGTSASPDSPCPNCEFGLYDDSYAWNPTAQSLIQANFDFPIFAIRPSDPTAEFVYNFINASVAFNKERSYTQYPLKAMDFELFMWAAVNSATCLRRGWCQTVGGFSVFSTASMEMAADDNKPIMVVSANMDSRSLFHDLTVGATQDVSGLVTVLAIAETLSRAPVGLASLPKHILYTLFTAESWGFAGSQRFVDAISTPFECTNATRAVSCPYSNAPCTFPCVRDLHFSKINFDKIESMLEFQSVSGINSNYSDYFVHVDDSKKNQSLATVLTSQNLTLASSDGVERRLPPSSAMSFLKKNRNIEAAVVTDYRSELGNLYSNDLDYTTPPTESICSLVNKTAKIIYEQAGGNQSQLLSANCTLVSTMYDCLVSNFSCPFMQDYFNVSKVEYTSHYSSVLSFENPQPQLIERFVFSFLSDMTGRARSGSNCQTIKDCQTGEYCIKSQCISTMTTYHEAYGTGLQYDEATGIVNVVDPNKGTWTESTWDDPVVRTFLITSKRTQIMELMVGLAWLIISIITVLFIKRYLKKTLKTE